jgi:hypothetical protein
VCSCNSSWTGDDCQAPICFGLSATDSAVCGGHGNCTAPDECSCSDGYHEPQCVSSSCYGVSSPNSKVCSGRGRCIADDTCDCGNGYAGYICQRICSYCSTNYK